MSCHLAGKQNNRSVSTKKPTKYRQSIKLFFPIRHRPSPQIRKRKVLLGRMRLAGRVAVVIGGAQGIGRAYVEALLAKGARVVTGDILHEIGGLTVDELGEQYGADNIAFLPCQVSDEQQIRALFELALLRYKQVDVVVNTAGLINESDWQACVQVNLGGAILVTNLALEYLGKDKKGQGGVLVHTASLAGLAPQSWGPVYSATKYGIVGLTRSWAMPTNYSEHGVRCNCICPSTVDTTFLQQTDRAYRADRSRQYLAGVDKLTPAFVAEGLVSIIEDETKNGEALTVTKERGLEYIKFQSFPKQ